MVNKPLRRSLKVIGWCGLFALALTGSAIGETPAKLDFSDITKPEFFPILPWDPYHGWKKPGIERGQESGLESIAECNFNMAGFVQPKDLRLCKKLGLGAIVVPSDSAFTSFGYFRAWRK